MMCYTIKAEQTSEKILKYFYLFWFHNIARFIKNKGLIKCLTTFQNSIFHKNSW